jgi:hypothetical protein
MAAPSRLDPKRVIMSQDALGPCFGSYAQVLSAGNVAIGDQARITRNQT